MILYQLKDQTAVVGVIGLGYVGLPLAVEAARAGFRVVGFDVNERVVEGINDGRSHIQDVDATLLHALVGEGLIAATTDMARLGECDAISICVPTPLSKIKDPDLSYVASAASAIRATLRPGQLVILESTTYPGTTREVLLPILEESGLEVGENFFLCFSPERVDPGNPTWHTKNTPKVLGGVTAACTEAGIALYDRIFDILVPMSNPEIAELTKVYENTFRMINIGLVNEMAQACERLDIDVWEVIDAAATKPFGFMRFTPGPGLGGDYTALGPHYLAWKMRTLGYNNRMIDLASQVNGEMPGHVVRKVTRALNVEGKSVNGARILVLGIAYKKDIDDLRKSPAIEIMSHLQGAGAEVDYHDPHCPELGDDGHSPLLGLPMRSVELSDAVLAGSDAVVIVTDHSAVDYDLVAESARLVVDARGVMRGRAGSARVVGLSGNQQARPEHVGPEHVGLAAGGVEEAAAEVDEERVIA